MSTRGYHQLSERLFVVTSTMTIALQVGVKGHRIVVREPASGFYAIYSKTNDLPRLRLERRKPTGDLQLVAEASQAAVSKARELGWMV